MAPPLLFDPYWQQQGSGPVAAPSIVQSTGLVAVASNTSATFTLSKGTTAGNALVIAVGGYMGGGTNKTFTFPSGWQSKQVLTPGQYGCCSIAILTSPTAGTKSITVTGPTSTYFSGEMFEVSGLSASPIATGASAQGTTTGTSIVLTAANALATPRAISFSAICYDGTNNQTEAFAVSSPWVSQFVENNGTNYEAAAGASQIYSNGGTPTVTWTGLVADSYGYAAQILTLMGN